MSLLYWYTTENRCYLQSKNCEFKAEYQSLGLWALKAQFCANIEIYLNLKLTGKIWICLHNNWWQMTTREILDIVMQQVKRWLTAYKKVICKEWKPVHEHKWPIEVEFCVVLSTLYNFSTCTGVRMWFLVPILNNEYQLWIVIVFLCTCYITCCTGFAGELLNVRWLANGCYQKLGGNRWHDALLLLTTLRLLASYLV